jgi:hypothetical protein
MALDDIEIESDGQVIAQRNLRLGLWAEIRLGYRGKRLTAYARDVMAEDYRLPGPGDVIGKIAEDFAVHGVDIPADVIAHHVQSNERQVRSELLVTDERPPLPAP